MGIRFELSKRSRNPSATGVADPAVGASVRGLNDDARVRQALSALLEQVDEGCRDLQSELERLEREYDGAVYSELIHLLSHLSIGQQDAKRHWTQIAEHQRSMERRLGTTVDPRVALLDYFVAVNCKLKNPKIIEMRLFEQTQESAYRDELTGLYNYRFFSEHLAREIARRDRANAALSLAIIDIDDFKHYNDCNGHAAGNDALQVVARLLAESLRTEDVVARYGGEEFAMILPSTPKLGARELAERVRSKISLHRFPNGDRQPGGMLSVSIGIATLPADAADTDDLLRNADLAMYQAKTNGKNQVQLFGRSSRSHRRVQAALNGNFRLFEDESHPLTTVSISDGGLLFVSDRHLPEGSLIEIMLELPGSDQEEPIIGRVIHTKQTASRQFEAAVSLDKSSGANRRFLTRWISGTN